MVILGLRMIKEVMLRTIRIAVIALAIGAGVAIGALPAAAATAPTAHQTGAFVAHSSRCGPRPTAGYCG